MKGKFVLLQMFFVGLCRIVQILRHTQGAEWVKETVLVLIGVS